MKFRLCLFALLVISLVTLGNAPVHAQSVISPQATLLSYYSALNLRNYPAAYAFWENPTQGYNDFAAGFQLTDHIEPYFGAFQAATTPGIESGRVPGLLLGYHVDGTVESYFGCFSVGPVANVLRIVSADFRLASNTYLPDPSAVLQFMAINCYAVPDSIPAAFNRPVTDKGRGLLTSYYTLINRRDYANAYAQWLQPIPGPKPNGAPAQDYRLPYNQFVAGYGDTVYVTTYLGDYQESGGFAGHGYVNGLEPAVLVGLHTDGSVSAFYGCYVLGGGAVPGGFGIVSGSFKLLTNGEVPTGDQIIQGLNVDCTTLNLQF